MQHSEYYIVGGHGYCISYASDRDNGATLLPSSEPFKVQSLTDAAIFTIEVNNDWHPEHQGDEIGQFDCGGINHGVWQLSDGSYQIQVSDVYGKPCCLMQCNSNFTHAKMRLSENPTRRAFGLNDALMIMYALAGSQNQTLLMHASVVRKDGKAVLCLGVSGTGKSTHTSLWIKHIEGTDLLNDDNPVVRIMPDGEVRVFGSPWSGKTPCYRNESAPVMSFLQLKQAPFNKIETVGPIHAFTFLLPSCSVMKWDKLNYTSTCKIVERIIESTPVRFLQCLPDRDAALTSYNAIYGE